MNERTKTFWFGLFIIVTLALLAWLLVFLRPSSGDGRKQIKVYFSNIEGINVGSRVTFAGKPVGEVKSIKLIADARSRPMHGDLYFYELTLQVDSSVTLYSYDKITVASTGLLGEKTIAIVPKMAPQGLPPAEEITATAVYGSSEDKLEELLALGHKIECSLAKVGRFFDENTCEAHAALKSVRAASDQICTFFSQANDKDVLDSACRAFACTEQAMQGIDQLAEQLNNMAFSASSGQGTLGKLLNCDDLYFQLNDAMSRFETLLDDINNYGLLFQYDKAWQRKRCYRAIQN